MIRLSLGQPKPQPQSKASYYEEHYGSANKQFDLVLWD